MRVLLGVVVLAIAVLVTDATAFDGRYVTNSLEQSLTAQGFHVRRDVKDLIDRYWRP